MATPRRLHGVGGGGGGSIDRCTQNPSSPEGHHWPGGFSPRSLASHFACSHLGGVRRESGKGTTGGDLDTLLSNRGISPSRVGRGQLGSILSHRSLGP